MFASTLLGAWLSVVVVVVVVVVVRSVVVVVMPQLPLSSSI
ncbi:hypothetical protein [Rickettsiales endosymbiont of Trichoplax sp. H2]|nr:hypothetical protein [Rickettsiales endosymbiont of Trichoplax sp. H2]